MADRVLGGRYTVQDKIGIGGMATVYRGLDTVLGRTVAIKTMLPQYANDPSFAARFKQEAQAAAALQSPYIVSVYDWGKDGDTYYIIMEYLRGTDLKSGIKKHGALGYAKSLAPAGVAFPLNAVVWLIEVFSTILRLITLAVRLFCNLFAGHVVMGTFAILASLFFQPVLTAFSAAAVAQAGASVMWVLILLVIYVVEIMVAAIQAYVFALLSAVYIQIAESDEE